MLINETEIEKRLNNPMNLINRMKSGLNGNNSRKNAMSLFINPNRSIEKLDKQSPVLPAPASFNPFTKPATASATVIPEKPKTGELVSTSELVANADGKIELALAHDDALKLLSESVKMMRTKLDDIKPDKLPTVIASAGRIVESIRKERAEASKSSKDLNVHHHFYMPEQRTMESYEVIEVNG